jgi:hypothetical protein
MMGIFILNGCGAQPDSNTSIFPQTPRISKRSTQCAAFDNGAQML